MAFEVISRKYFIGFCATRSWLVGSHVTLLWPSDMCD